MDIIQLRRGKLSDWNRINPVLDAGEIGVVFNSDTLEPLGIKVGNGFLNFIDLPFIGSSSGPSIDTYTKEEIDAKIAVVSTSISNLAACISNQASSENPALSRSEIISLIESNASRLLSSNSEGAPFASLSVLENPSTPKYYNGQVIDELKPKDSAFVLSPESSKYIYQGDIWVYAGSNITFSQAQWDAINSGITAELITQFVTNAELITALADKVDKESGKGLSSNDFTDAEKSKLAGIEAGAQVNSVNSVNNKAGNVTLDASDVGADPSGTASSAVADHNTSNSAHQALFNSKQPNLLGQNNYNELLMTPPSEDGGQPGALPRSTFAGAAETANALADKVDKESGKGLSTNDFTTSEKNKLSGIEAGAQVNTIEKIKLNGNEVVPDANKVVDLGAIATSESLNALTDRVSTIEQTDLPSKADKVNNATANNFAGLDASGNLKDSGKNASDFATAAQGALADTSLQPSDVDASLNSLSTNPVQNKAIAELIPNDATSSNQLADKAFVNSSISTNTANFLGTYNIITDLGLTLSASKSDIISALVSVLSTLGKTATTNDYVFVSYPDLSVSGQYTKFDRYKYSSSWAYEYTLNNSSFTTAQWAAINSGITSGKIAELENLIAGKQERLIPGTAISIAADGKTISAIPTDQNVTLSTDLYTDVSVGHAIVTGAIPTKIGNRGDTLKQVFTNIFGNVQDTQPTAVQPSITISFPEKPASAEYGTSVSQVNYSISVNNGSYTYGPATGIEWSNFNISADSVSATGQSGTVTLSSPYIVGNSPDVAFNASAVHTAGTIAKTSFGNESNPVIQITTGTKTHTASYSISSVFYLYAKVTNSTTAPTSDATSQVSLTPGSHGGYIITTGNNTYLWFLSKSSKTTIQQYAAGQWNNVATISAGQINLTLATGATTTYYAYRTDEMMSATEEYKII